MKFFSQALQQAENEVERLHNELKELARQLADKHVELNQAEQEERKLKMALDARQRELEEINQSIQKLEQDLTQAKSRLDTAIASLTRMQETLHREEQLELERQKAVEQQTTVVNEATNQVNETSLKAAQAREAANEATRAQLEAQSVVDDLDYQLDIAATALALALAAVAATATAIWIPYVGQVAAAALTTFIIARKAAIAILSSKLGAAKSRCEQVTRRRNELLTVHRTAEAKKQQACENLDRQKQVLQQTTTAWKQQIEKKNAAKQAVERQTEVMKNATVVHENVLHNLENAKQKQFIKTNEVHEAEMQLNRQRAQIEILNSEVNDLQKRKDATQHALNNAKATLTNAQKRSEKADLHLKTLNEQRVKKETEVKNTEKSVEAKQQEILKSQTQHAIKQENAWRAANKVALIQQDLDVAGKNLDDIKEEIRLQTDKLTNENGRQEQLKINQKTIENKLDEATREKERVQQQIEHYKTELNEQNSMMIQKKQEIYSAVAALEIKKQQKSDLKNRHDQYATRRSKILDEVHEYSQALEQNKENALVVETNLQQRKQTWQVSKIY